MSVGLPWCYHTGSEANDIGIVVCVGDEDMIHAIHLIRSLRKVLNSALPIEIALAGDQDLSPANQALIGSLGPDIVTIDLLDSFNDTIARLSNGTFLLKHFAMLAFRFQNVVLADAGIIFPQTPEPALRYRARLDGNRDPILARSSIRRKTRSGGRHS